MEAKEIAKGSTLLATIRSEFAQATAMDLERELYLLLEKARFAKPRMSITEAASHIKSLPTDQAIQKIKGKISGMPETAQIDGELVVILI